MILALGKGDWVQLSYMVAALLFVFGIKQLSRVKTARKGNQMAASAMLLATVATMVLLWGQVALWIIVAGVLVGGVAGYLLATKTPMTAMPELVAVFNGMGGAASMFVALSEVSSFTDSYSSHALHEVASKGGASFAVAIMLSILIGGVTLSGSLIAYAKLAGKIWKNRLGPLGDLRVNAVLAAAALGVLVWAGFGASGSNAVLAAFVLMAVALVLGVGLVIAIGGADMPVVISLLNSYSGLAASATGFVLQNELLVIAGSLVGAAGLILTSIMCKAMNRSLSNVLFGGFGGDEETAKDDTGYTNVKSTSAEEVAPLLEMARKVIIVPGYGMAVAQAQHKVRELGDLLEQNGCDVSYAIHPVAGRMPGHMNVLLAEADVSYDKLYDLDQINSEFKNCDIAIVIGANDVCNPAASDPTSAIAGMPVLDVWDAQTVIVIKRSLSAGYAGIKNSLFEMDNSLMLFADGKAAVEDMITEYKDL